MRAEVLSSADLVALTESEAALLGSVTAETSAAGAASVFLGASFGKARGEAVVLARELATGGNYIRTMGSLLGALGVPISIAATAGFVLWTYFKKQAEAIKEAGLEQAKLNVELEKELHTLGEIKNIGQYEKFTETTRERLDLLKQEAAIETDPKKLTAINQRIAATETELARAPEIAVKALERANHEEQVKFEMQEQARELELQLSAQERVRAASAKRVETENAITKIKSEGALAGIDEARDAGEISALDAITQKAKIKRDVLQETSDRQIANDQKAIQSIKDQVALADVAEAAEEGKLKAITDRQAADVASNKTLNDAAAAYDRLSKESAKAQKDVDAAKQALEDTKGSVPLQRARGIDEASLTNAVAVAEKGVSDAVEVSNKKYAEQKNAAEQLTGAQVAHKAALEDEKTIQDELITQQGILKAAQQELTRARATGEGIPAAQAAVDQAKAKVDAEKKAADDETARETARVAKKQAEILRELGIEDQIQKAKDIGDKRHEAQLEIELNYQNEILQLISEGLTREQATAEAGIRKQQSEIAAQVAAGSPLEQSQARYAAQQKAVQEQIAEAKIKDLADRRARGAYGQTEEVTPGESAAQAAERTAREQAGLAAERESQFSQIKPPTDLEQYLATKALEAPTPPSATPEPPKPTTQPQPPWANELVTVLKQLSSALQ
jgi:hypothetical protein